MFDKKYFESIGEELNSLKNRVRALIKNKHWQTDDWHKESLLRSAIRRLTAYIGVGASCRSPQIL